MCACYLTSLYQLLKLSSTEWGTSKFMNKKSKWIWEEAATDYLHFYPFTSFKRLRKSFSQGNPSPAQDSISEARVLTPVRRRYPYEWQHTTKTAWVSSFAYF